MKKALLVVSFGTSYEPTRKKTIDVCEQRLAEAFEDHVFFRAYTSQTIIQKLAKRDGLKIDSPTEALLRIYEGGYEEVRVQSLHIICGEEYEKLEKVISQFEGEFKKLTLGKPLLTSREDYDCAIDAVIGELPVLNEEEAIVWMGHGTTHGAFSSYCTLEHMMRARGVNAYVGTVEGYPTFEQVCSQLQQAKVQKVYLIPFMLVAGDHALHDMASDEGNSWKVKLEQQRICVVSILKGLGENPGIQALFVAHSKMG
ncbi:MAG: sirohydrochlorin cobaltochelatase [Cellulosilyticaceae bacterium]